MPAVTPRQLFRAGAVAEAITWTLLIAGLVIRAVAPTAAIAVTIGGGIHGFVFLAYGATAVLVALNQRWHPGTAVLAVAAAVVPYATIPVELWLARSGRLDGAWRLDATDDPRDARPIDRLLRVLLRHPAVLVALAAVVLAAVFTVLLLAGPPGGR